MTSHSLSLRLLEYDIFILILAHLKKIPNGFYKKIAGYYVLTRQVIQMSEQGKRTTTELNFSDIQPLSSSS